MPIPTVRYKMWRVNVLGFFKITIPCLPATASTKKSIPKSSFLCKRFSGTINLRRVTYPSVCLVDLLKSDHLLR